MAGRADERRPSTQIYTHVLGRGGRVVQSPLSGVLLRPPDRAEDER